jgi:Transglutaminase-like superfamily
VMRPASGGTGPTLLECWMELLLSAAAIRSPWRRRYLMAFPLPNRRPLAEADIRSTLQTLEGAAGHHLKPMSCLERSAAAQRVLRRRGVPAELRLGVRGSDAGDLQAHAWIEIEGKPVDALAPSFAALEGGGQRRLAGIRLLTDATLSLPNDGTDTDAECAVLLGPPPDGIAEEWLALPEPPGGGRAWVRKDGRSVALESAGSRGEAVAALLRWAVPFASALQGKVILHASAVSRGRQAWAFVGESGAGKSALARTLSGRGWAAVADDLLACRLAERRGGEADGERGAVAVLSGRGRLELGAVFFVERTTPSAQPRAERLPPAQALRLLLHHGFGELGNGRIWRSQFEFYGTLAERVATYRFEMPDDLGRLAEAAVFLEERLRP